MSENARNYNATTTGDRNGNKQSSGLIETPPQSFVPIKARIHQMEDESSKLDSMKQSKNDDNHFKRHQNNGNGKTEEEEEAPVDCDVDSNKLQKTGSAVVPTPLPRSSRNNSMTDPSSSEDSSAAGSPRPSPMPRATVGSAYKVPKSGFLCFSSVAVLLIFVGLCTL